MLTEPLDGFDTMANVRLSPSLSVAESVPETAVPAVVLTEPLLAVGAVLPPPWSTMGCEMSHWLSSFDQMDCSAKLPLPMVTLAAPPAWPGAIQAHSSPFSWPLEALVQPPAGNISDTISENSWPRVMV